MNKPKRNINCDDIRQTSLAGVVLLDARSTEEFKAGNLPEKRNISP